MISDRTRARHMQHNSDSVEFNAVAVAVAADRSCPCAHSAFSQIMHVIDVLYTFCFPPSTYANATQQFFKNEFPVRHVPTAKRNTYKSCLVCDTYIRELVVLDVPIQVRYI